MGKKIADLLIKLGADTYAFTKMRGDVKKQLDGLSKDLQGFGKSMSLYVTAPLTAAAGTAVHLADVQLQAEQRLLTALKGRTEVQKRLVKQAGELQSRSLFGDEVIIGQQAFLASLGMTEQQINKIIEASAQLSTATGMTLESAVKNLAKTYGGLTGELGESIPQMKQFTAEQLKGGAAVDYVLSKYKGFAETAARTGLGPLGQLKMALGDLAEEFGMVLIPVVQKVVGWVQDLVTWLQSLSPATKTAIVVVGGLAAAIGPLSMGLGAILRMLPAIQAGFLALTGPVGAITLLIGTATAAILGFNASAKQASMERISKKAQQYINSGKSVEELKQMREAASAKNQKAASDYQKASDRLNPLKSESLASYVQYYSDNKKSKIRANADVAISYEKVSALDEAIKYLETVAPTTISVESGDGVVGSLGLLEKLQQKLSDLEKAKKAATSTYEIHNLNLAIQKLKEEIEVVSNGGLKQGVVSKEYKDALNEKWKGEIKPLQFDPSAINPPESDWTEARERLRQNVEDLKNEAKGAFVDFGEMFSGLVQNAAFAIGEGLGNILGGDGTFDDLLASFGKMVGQFLVSLGKQLIATSTIIEKIKVALENIWDSPWAGIVVGVAAISAGQALIASFNRRAEKGVALANGGLAYGPTMALVGDNRGAGYDPEVIAPLSKLRQYGLGSQTIEFVGAQIKLSGSDLLLSIRREDAKINYVNALS